MFRVTRVHEFSTRDRDMSKRKKADAAVGEQSRKTIAPAKHDRLWLVVADGCHARILEGDRDHSGVALVLEAAAPRMGGAARSRSHAMHRHGDAVDRHVIAPLRTLKIHE